VVINTSFREKPLKKLISFDYSNDINKQVNVDCFIRKKWAGPLSRDHDVGPRLVQGLINGGWEARYFDTEYNDLKIAISDVKPRFSKICVLDVEDIYVNKKSTLKEVLEIIRGNYQIVIGVLYDSWQIETQAMLVDVGGFFDYFWGGALVTSMNSLNLYHSVNTIFFPLPAGIDSEYLNLLRSQINSSSRLIGFSGGIGLANPSRMYWRSELNNIEQIKFDLSSHLKVNINPINDYKNYLQRLSNNYASLNFSLRGNSDRTPTARSFEVPSIGRLLIQEYTDDLHYYFNPGEHFLEFSNAKQLRNITEEIKLHPEIVTEIAKSASIFFDSRYSDKMLVKHLQAILFA